MTIADLYDRALTIGLTGSEFEQMEYGEFADRVEIHERNEIRTVKYVRMILGAQVGKDPRQIIPLPGDFDHVPKLLSQEENKKILSKHGIDKMLQGILDGKKKK
ncbi:MAG: hypothetical protein R3356_06255 [Eudoraea sp.]|nr:hypothetical protein [Eudoraea sp.]